MGPSILQNEVSTALILERHLQHNLVMCGKPKDPLAAVQTSSTSSRPVQRNATTPSLGSERMREDMRLGQGFPDEASMELASWLALARVWSASASNSP